MRNWGMTRRRPTINELERMLARPDDHYVIKSDPVRGLSAVSRSWWRRALSWFFPYSFALLLAFPAFAQTGVTGNAVSLLDNLTNAVRTVKGTRGQLVWLQCDNPNAGTTGFVQVFDVAAAQTPILGASSPRASFPFHSAASASYQINATMLNGIKVAATTTSQGGAALGSALNCNAGFQ